VKARDGAWIEVGFAGGVIRAMSRGGAAGDEVAVSLRPEALRALGPGEVAPAGWATLGGKLGVVEYLGPVTRFGVTLADGTSLQLMALAPPAAAEEVRVAYDPRSVVVVGAVT
jgi:hypothetical protein